MTIIDRAQHYLDKRDGSSSTICTIGNYLNYRTPAGIWIPTDLSDFNLATVTPPDWNGLFDFNYEFLTGPVQCFGGDTTDANNTTLIGMRSSEYPNYWINYKCVNIDGIGIQPTVYAAEKALRWVNIWNNVDLYWGLKNNGLRKVIRLKSRPHRASFRFALRYSNTLTHEIIDNCILYKRVDNGDVVIQTRPPWAKDASDSNIDVTLTAGAPVTVGNKTFPTIVITPNATQLLTATYPVNVDPTTVISGTAAIEDTRMVQSQNTFNYGGTTEIMAGRANAGNWHRFVIRLTNAATIPSGSISDFSMKVYQGAFAQSTQSTTGTVALIKDANTWVEGTSLGGLQVGSCSWGHAVYNTQLWAGSVGCDTANTDYYATDPTYPKTTITIPAYTSGADVLRTFSLPPTLAAHWRDGVRVRNGVIVFSDTEGVFGGVLYLRSTEYSSNQPTFDITYSVAKPWISLHMSGRR